VAPNRDKGLTDNGFLWSDHDRPLCKLSTSRIPKPWPSGGTADVPGGTLQVDVVGTMAYLAAADLSLRIFDNTVIIHKRADGTFGQSSSTPVNQERSPCTRKTQIQSSPRCGYRCDLCPAYRQNIHGPEDQQRTSDGWFKYYGFRIPPEQIRCDGCLDGRPEARRIDTTCPIGPCAISRGLTTCAACPDWGCERSKSRTVTRAHPRGRQGRATAHPPGMARGRPVSTDARRRGLPLLYGGCGESAVPFRLRARPPTAPHDGRPMRPTRTWR
jgi:hypothetical protein